MNLPRSTRALLGLALLAAAPDPGAAQPVTITFAAQQYGSALGNAEGGELAAESLIRFGYFSIPLSEVVAGLETPGLLESSFIQLAATRVGYFGGTTILDATGAVISNQEPSSPYEEAPGLFGHTLTYDPEAMGLMAARYFLWVVDTPDAGNANQYSLFSDDAWISPSTIGEVVYDVSTTDPNDPDDVYHADRGPELSSVPGFGPLNKLRAIEGIPAPEPGLPALLLTATGLLVWRRRRPTVAQP
jgi:hypothetical protein